MRRTLYAVLLAASACAPVLAASPAIRAVPGSGAGYLYFPAAGDGTILKVVKENVTSVPAGIYEVHFTFEGNPEEQLCDNMQTECEKTLKPGTVKLRIAGDWIPGKLAMSGKFSGACSGIDNTCQFALQPGSNTVRIKVGCNAHDYSVVKLGGNDTALCVGLGLHPGQNAGKVLLAAHKKIQSGKAVQNAKKTQWGNSSWEDGQDNSEILINNWSGDASNSAAHYCGDLSLGSGASKLIEWYLPAISELELALSGWSDDDLIIPPETQSKKNKTGYFSSTNGTKKKGIWGIHRGSGNSREWVNVKDGQTLCIHGVGS